LNLSPLPGEFSVDDLFGMTFEDRPLPVLGRDDVIFEGTSTLLAAREKGGKSTLVRHLCHNWVLDGHRVLYLSEEWRRVWRRQLEPLGIEKGGGHFQIVEALGQEPDKLRRRAAHGSEDIVVLDTVTWLLGISLASRDQVVEGLKPWVTLCASGKTLILLAHLTKKGELEGSHAFGAGVDTLITYVEAGDDLRIVDRKSRMLAETPPPFAVRKTGSTFSIEDAPNELTLTTAQAEVLEILPTHPNEALTWEKVSERTGFKEAKTRKVLHDLVDHGLARDITGHLGTGGRGHAARYVAVEVESA